MKEEGLLETYPFLCQYDDTDAERDGVVDDTINDEDDEDDINRVINVQDDNVSKYNGNLEKSELNHHNFIQNPGYNSPQKSNEAQPNSLDQI